MRCAFILGAAVLLIACHPPKPVYVGVRGAEVSAHLEQLRRDGEAQLATVMVAPGKPVQPAEVETVFFAQTVTVGKLTASIEVLATGCPAATEATGAGDCALERYADTPIKLRELARPERAPAKPNNAPAVIFGGLALGAAGTMVWCIAECESNKGLKSMGLGFGAALLGLISYVAAGGTIRD